MLSWHYTPLKIRAVSYQSLLQKCIVMFRGNYLWLRLLNFTTSWQLRFQTGYWYLFLNPRICLVGLNKHHKYLLEGANSQDFISYKKNYLQQSWHQSGSHLLVIILAVFCGWLRLFGFHRGVRSWPSLLSPMRSAKLRCQIRAITSVSMATHHSSAYTWLGFPAGEAGRWAGMAFVLTQVSGSTGDNNERTWTRSEANYVVRPCAACRCRLG